MLTAVGRARIWARMLAMKLFGTVPILSRLGVRPVGGGNDAVGDHDARVEECGSTRGDVNGQVVPHKVVVVIHLVLWSLGGSRGGDRQAEDGEVRAREGGAKGDPCACYA